MNDAEIDVILPSRETVKASLGSPIKLIVLPIRGTKDTELPKPIRPTLLVPLPKLSPIKINSNPEENGIMDPPIGMEVLMQLISLAVNVPLNYGIF